MPNTSSQKRRSACELLRIEAPGLSRFHGIRSFRITPWPRSTSASQSASGDVAKAFNFGMQMARPHAADRVANLARLNLRDLNRLIPASTEKPDLSRA